MNRKGNLFVEVTLVTLIGALIIVTPIVVILTLVFSWSVDFAYNVWLLGMVATWVILTLLWR